MPYIGKSPTGSGVRQRYHYTATGGETSLSGADDNSKTLKFTDGEYVDVYLNGILLVQGTDYGVGTANTISNLTALAANDIVEVIVYDIYNVAKINSEAVRTRHYFTASGGETSIGTSQISGLSFAANEEIDVKLNGVSLVAGTDYNTTTANTVGGLTALTAGQVVEIVIYEKFQLADVVSKAAGGTYNGQVIADGGLDMNGKELILDTDGDSKIEAGTDDTVTFSTANSEAMRINSSGTLMVGHTASGSTNDGVELRNGDGTGGYALTVTNENNDVVSINRKTSNGRLTTLRFNGTEVGSLRVRSGLVMSIVLDARASGVGMTGSGARVLPANESGEAADNAKDLGSSGTRWDDIYATNGTIQTSDENEKQQIASLTSAEITAAKAISKLFKTFKWNDKVESKGDSARTHTGVIAQQVETAMTDAGLDAGDYAFFISTDWHVDADGNEVDADAEGAIAKNRKGIRYPELLSFIGAATEQRLADLETRVQALEDA